VGWGAIDLKPGRERELSGNLKAIHMEAEVATLSGRRSKRGRKTRGEVKKV